jgi:hypothetical protein
MGVIRSLINVTALGGAGTLAGWTFWTRNSKFVPLSATDPIFSLPAYAKNNPNRNPATQDLCVRKVPLSKIKPQLLENDGKLVEAFCAGVWGGLGERFFLRRGEESTEIGEYANRGNRLRISTILPLEEIPKRHHDRPSIMVKRRA